MPDWKNWLSWLDASLLPFIPPSLIGACIGLAYPKNQTPRQRAGSFVISAALSVYATGAVAENFHYGTATLSVIAILLATVGTDMIGGLIAAGRAWKADPFSTFARWWSLIRPGGGYQPPVDVQPPQGGGDPLRRDS